MRRSITIGLIVVALFVSLVLPAMALIQDSGSISCGSNYIAGRSLGLGTVRHYVPSGTQVAWWANDYWTHRSNATQISSATWKVTAGVGLAEPTYAWCYGS